MLRRRRSPYLPSENHLLLRRLLPLRPMLGHQSEFLLLSRLRLFRHWSVRPKMRESRPWLRRHLLESPRRKLTSPARLLAPQVMLGFPRRYNQQQGNPLRKQVADRGRACLERF